jgi:ParE toxin of type II toxin-antitoxin system, parDE
VVAAAGSLPAARAAAWFQNWAWAIPVAGLGFTLLLFPTGRLRSPRWRPAAWFAAAVFTLETVDMVARAPRLRAHPYTPLSDGWYQGLHTADVILVPAALLVGAAAAAESFPYGSPDLRRLRAGRYRVFYTIDEERRVIQIDHVP